MLDELSFLPRRGFRRGSVPALAFVLASALLVAASAGQALAADPPPPTPGAGPPPPAATPPRAADTLPHDAVDPTEQRPATAPAVTPLPADTPPPEATTPAAPAPVPPAGGPAAGPTSPGGAAGPASPGGPAGPAGPTVPAGPGGPAEPTRAQPGVAGAVVLDPATGKPQQPDHLRSAAPVGQRPMTRGKRWEVGATLEYHHLLRQNDVAGAGVNRNLVYLGLDGRWEFTPNDRVTLEGGLYRHTFGDQGETGYRLDDVYTSYTHRFLLPAEVTMRLTGGVTVPTSLASQRASMIAAPRLRLQADRTFGNFTIDARVFGEYFIDKFASNKGGNANPEARIAMVLAVGYDMPFHPPLEVGASIYTAYYGYYDVHNETSRNSQFFGAVDRPNQPVYQDYGWEVFVRYDFPTYKGFSPDFTATLAQGDPTIGYTSVLHDGVQHVSPLFRQVAEVYFALGVRY